MLFSVARVLRSFSPLSSSITRSDLNLALKFLLCLDIMMNPHFHTDFSISDSLIFVRKSVLIYETIITPRKMEKEKVIMLKFICGVLVGGIIGVVMMCLLQINKI
ncbi:DUF3789 domain-containing protein [[Ruminococcus] lactaris]